MISTASIPGLRFTAAPRPAEPSPLRSDVAGFLGTTRRGPVGRAVRVEGWREYLDVFGGLEGSADTPYAVSGYFENGGEVAWILRLCASPLANAYEVWKVDRIAESGIQWDPASGGFHCARFRVEASSPGAWANAVVVSVRYWREGPGGTPAVDIVIEAPGEPPEYLIGVPPASLGNPGGFISRLIRIVPDGPLLAAPAGGAPPGPRSVSWKVTLSGGAAARPVAESYAAAGILLNDVPEIALLAAPDLYQDLADDDDRIEFLSALLQRADQLHDRMVLVDVPPKLRKPREVLGWVLGLSPGRAAAAYHPPLKVPDPLGTLATPLRTVPPSGHVAGVISRLDRERGAHHTPANTEVYEAVDTARSFGGEEEAELILAGVNLVRCRPGRGLQVWGGRTLDPEAAGLYVAHRRLIHRLVRAIRRVAEPLVFDINGPELWLAFVRAVTTVLLEAWRAGALKGSRPEESFRVQCDDKTNPPEERGLGRVMCLIEVAPAVPMEFIELRVSLSAEGVLEVFES